MERMVEDLAEQDLKAGKLPQVETHTKAMTEIAEGLDIKSPEKPRAPKLLTEKSADDRWATQETSRKHFYSGRQKQIINRIRKLFADPLFSDSMKVIFVAQQVATRAGDKTAAVRANQDYQKLIAQSVPVYGPLEKEPSHLPEDYHEFFTTNPMRFEDI